MHLCDLFPTQFKIASYAAAEHGFIHICVSIRFLWTSLTIYSKWFGSNTDNQHNQLSAVQLLQIVEGLRKAISGFVRKASVLISDTTFLCVQCVASIDIKHEISGFVLYIVPDWEWRMLLIRSYICAFPRQASRSRKRRDTECRSPCELLFGTLEAHDVHSSSTFALKRDGIQGYNRGFVVFG